MSREILPVIYMIRAYSSTYSHTYMPPTSIFEQTSSTGQWLPEQQRDDLVMKCLRRNFLLWSKRSKALLSPTYPLPIAYVLQKCAPAKSLKKCNFGELLLNLLLLATFKEKRPKWRFLEIVSEQVILPYAYVGLNHLLYLIKGKSE